jgi:hypothetical protein
MIVPDSLNTRPAAIHHSQLRAPARDAQVRSNSDHYRDNAAQKMQNGRAFCTAIGVCTAQTVASFPCKLRMSQLSAIEIP